MNKFEKFLIVIIVLLFSLNGYQLYKYYHQPKYLMTVQEEYWAMLDSQEKQIITESLFRYSTYLNPEWKDRAMYIYMHNGLYMITFVSGRIEKVTVPKMRKEDKNV